MNNFSTRVISAIVYAAIFIFAIVYSPNTYIGLITFFGSICLWEFSKIIQLQNVLLSIISLVLLISLNYLKILDTNKIIYLLIFCLLHSIYLIIDLYSKNFSNRNPILKSFTTISYVVLPFFFLTFLPFLNGTYQPNLIVYIILIIWTNDSFAYLVGKNFGKTKLFERISPKKTIEGFVGGFLFAVFAGFLIGRYSNILSTQSWLIIAVLTSILGTFGDLVESKFKRQASVKDSGTIMPGHGGLLDRLDSLFFLAPFVYLYIHYLM
ncbi:phosphatidate cytidylyltransferase [Tenacibaculum sp. MEBiC06402]|uniref:phosphatidate cytidylyltransferase n=1 Tax=unclassified Tenacibaculum TaxID=2635139 RepID=UPI003B9CD7FF